MTALPYRGSHLSHDGSSPLTSPPTRDSISPPLDTPASPPYGSLSGLPPTYQSRPNLATSSNESHSTSSADKGKSAAGQPSQYTHAQTSSAAASLYSSPAANTASLPRSHGQGPRIAVTDPLSDMRLRNLSKPEGLLANSDLPTNQKDYKSPATPLGARPTFVNDKDHPAFSSTRPGLTRRDSDVSSADGQDYDDFDWSDEEDVEENAKFEAEKIEQLRFGRKKLSLWSFFRFLATTFLGNLIVSVSLVVPAIVIQFVYRPRNNSETPPDVASHRDFVADNLQAWFIWAAFNLHIMWWLHIIVELLPRVALGLVAAAWDRPSQRLRTLAEYFNAIKVYIKAILYAAVSWASWAIIFNSIFNLYDHSNPATNSRAHYLYRIYQVVEFFFFFTLTIAFEKIIIKGIAMSFHKSAYAERITSVTQALNVFDHLKDYSPKQPGSRFSTLGFGRTYNGGNSGSKTPATPPLTAGYEAGDEGSQTPRSAPVGLPKHASKRPPSHLYPPTGDPGSGSGHQTPTTPGGSKLTERAHARVLRGAKAVKTTASQASTLARVAMNDPYGLLQRQSGGVLSDINSPSAAKRLARSIFFAFRGNSRRTYLIPSDFDAAYSTTAEARAAFAVFDRDGNGDISQSEIKNTVLQTYKERRFLTKSMQDVNHAVGQLDLIFVTVALIIIMFEAFAIFDVDIGKTLTTFYSLAIAFAFIFKESAQNVFDSIIFLFVTHPFDTGDRIQLDEAIMVVKRMSLLSCEFTMADGTDMYVSNSLLASMMIINLRRSGYQWESVAITVAFDTPLDKLDAVQADMVHWLQTEPERLFEPSTAIVPQSIDYMRSLKCTVGMTHRANWQDWGQRFYRRNAFYAALSFYLRKHGIQFVSPNQPIIYWTEDAAQLPPSYESPSAGGGDGAADEPQSAINLNEEFRPTPPPSPTSAMPAGDGAEGSSAVAPTTTTSRPAGKNKTFMNFTPPQDEFDNDQQIVRRRRAKKTKAGLANQGGEG